MKTPSCAAAAAALFAVICVTVASMRIQMNAAAIERYKDLIPTRYTGSKILDAVRGDSVRVAFGELQSPGATVPNVFDAAFTAGKDMHAKDVTVGQTGDVVITGSYNNASLQDAHKNADAHKKTLAKITRDVGKNKKKVAAMQKKVSQQYLFVNP